MFLNKEQSNLLIKICDLLNQIPMRFIHQVHKISRNLFHCICRSKLTIITVNNGFLVYHIQLTPKRIFLTDWNQNRPSISRQFFAHRIYGRIKIRSHAIHFIDERNARYIVLRRLTPNSLRLRLDASDSIKYRNCTVKHPQRTLHFRCKVNVAWSVDDVNAHLLTFVQLNDARLNSLLPEAGCSSRSNSNATLALLLHPIRDGRAFVHFTHLMDHSRIKQNTLGKSRFARINVRGDPDIARFLERVSAIRRVRIC